jgi:hypothetical protein
MIIESFEIVAGIPVAVDPGIATIMLVGASSIWLRRGS